MIKDLCGFMLIGCLICAITSLCFYPLLVLECSEKGKSFDGTRFTFISGCMVMHHEKWIPLTNIRVDINP